MPKNVVCKKCKNLVNDWCEKVIDSPDPDMQRDCQYFCEKTNAGRIRAMSDEELAKFINRIVVCHHLKCVINERNCEKCPIHPANPCDTEGIADWLQQPAE